MLTEIACGPISESAVLDEIPFVCSLFIESGSAVVSVEYGLKCNTDALWQPKEIANTELCDWISRSIQDGVYEPGRSDIFIKDRGRLKVRLCHESDIHVVTDIAVTIQECASRWLAKGYRILRSDTVPPERGSWREVHSIQDATAGL